MDGLVKMTDEIKELAIKIKEQQRLAKQLVEEQGRERARKIDRDYERIRGKK